MYGRFFSAQKQGNGEKRKKKKTSSFYGGEEMRVDFPLGLMKKSWRKTKERGKKQGQEKKKG